MSLLEQGAHRVENPAELCRDASVVMLCLANTEVVREVPVPIAAPGSIIIDRPLRSGQQVYAKNADLVVLALVSHGAEVIADGSISAYDYSANEFLL